MRAAVFHDYFNAIGGGEKLALIIAKCLDADIITTEITIPGSFFTDVNVRLLGNLPRTPVLHQMKAMNLFYNCDFSNDYDYFIFSGNWAHYASNHHKPAVYYCNSPVRAIYDLYQVFLKRQPVYLQPIYALWAEYVRRQDQKSVGRIQSIVANSQNIQNRIQKYYHRRSQIIYPPIDPTRFHCRSYDFWLSVNRIYPEKRIDLQIDAFSQLLDEKLIIVGGYAEGDHAAPYANKIESRVKQYPNITLLGQIPETELISLFSDCKGLICTAMDEDFGITPLEAMASGKPVIAVGEGGFLETVTPKTGVFIDADYESLIDAIKRVSANPETFRDECIKQSNNFNISNFQEQIKETVKKLYETK